MKKILKKKKKKRQKYVNKIIRSIQKYLFFSESHSKSEKHSEKNRVRKFYTNNFL